MALMNNFPPGIRFTPTAEELILCFLPRRLNEEDFKPLIKDVNLYGDNKEPWTLFNSDERCFYVFTDLNKIGKRVQRRAGSGTWFGQYCKQVEDCYGNVIGVDRYFKFKTRGGSGDKHGRWTMHEFARVDERGDSLDDKVVCIIGHDTQISTKRSGSTPKKTRRLASSSHEENCAKRQCIETESSSPPSGLVVLEAQSCLSNGVGVVTAQIDESFGFDLFEPTDYVVQGNQIDKKSSTIMETCYPSSALVVMEAQSCIPSQVGAQSYVSGEVGVEAKQINGSLRFDQSYPTQHSLQCNPSSNLMASEAQPCSVSAAVEEAEGWPSFDDSGPILYVYMDQVPDPTAPEFSDVYLK